MAKPHGNGLKKDKTKRNRRLTAILAVGVLLMFGFCYLMVPLFNIVCKKTGINGKNLRSAVSPPATTTIDHKRTLQVAFTTVIHGGLRFNLQPLDPVVHIKPGEKKLVYFYAENNTGKDITVQAIPSITPIEAARFFKKIECFCFTQQHFLKNQKIKMPVYFYVDPGISSDVKEITLSYTLFDATGFEKKQKA